MRKRRLKRRLGDALDEERRAGHAYRQLSRELTRLRLALESVPDATVVFGENGQAVLHNAQGRLESALSPFVDAAIEELVASCSGPEPRSRTLELPGPPPKTVVIRAAPLCTSEERFGTVVVVEDISERRQLEAVRRDFVANVSHELRTPVGALALLGEALTGETDTGVIDRLATRVTAEAERASRMIEDLLDLSRIEANGLGNRQTVDVDAVVANAVERVRPLAELAKVEIVVQPETSALEVVGEEGQLSSAVANLVDNAVKYSDAGSTVKIKVRSLPEGWAEVAVRDRGIGIPARDLERIFERFYRVDRARSRQTGGSGLGLSIVRHVATNHGGQVLVESTEGKGSTFRLRLRRPDLAPE